MTTIRLAQEPRFVQFARLRREFGEPGAEQMIGLEETATLLADGKLDWQQVEAAIEDGWDPGSESILHYLYGADDAVETTNW